MVDNNDNNNKNNVNNYNDNDSDNNNNNNNNSNDNDNNNDNNNDNILTTTPHTSSYHTMRGMGFAIRVRNLEPVRLWTPGPCRAL